MTPVTKASYYPVDDKYPVYLETPVDWLKMSIDEAEQLIKELRYAIDLANHSKWKEAA